VIGSSTLSGGLAVLSVTPTVAGNHSITATYTPSPNFQASTTDAPWIEQITPLAATELLFGQQPTFSFTGTAFNPPVTVYIADMYGNLVQTPGIVTLAMGTNPTSATLGGFTTAYATNGVATFTNVSINKPGTGYTLSATCQGLTGVVSSPFTISSTTHFLVSPPATVQSNTGFSLTVVALTAASAQDPYYLGTVSVTASNGTATVTLVPSYTFTTADRGRYVFTGLQLPSAGHWTITVMDSLKPTVLGRATMTVTAPAPAVKPAVVPATHFSVTAPTSVTADTGFSLTATALTASNALATQYGGTVTITATSGTTTVTLLPSYTFTTADDGKYTFTDLELPSAGDWTITVSDVHAPTVLGRATVTAAAPPAPADVTMLTLAPLSLVPATSVVTSPVYPFTATALLS